MFCLKKTSCFPSIRSLTVCVNVKKCFLSTIKLLKVTCAVYLLTALPGHLPSEWLVAEAALCLLTSLDQRLTAAVEQWVEECGTTLFPPVLSLVSGCAGCGPPAKPLSSEGCFAPTALWFASFLLPFQFSGCISLLLLALVQRVVSDSSQPHGLYSPWNSPGQNTGLGSLFLLQVIFPTQGSNPGLPHCGWILYQLSHKGPHMNIFGLKAWVSHLLGL